MLKEVKPTAVLVEGPSDATGQLRHLVHKATRPPLAILCYTTERPVRSIVYPLASYSPEWIALTWGIRNGAETRLIEMRQQIEELDKTHTVVGKHDAALLEAAATQAGAPAEQGADIIKLETTARGKQVA